MTAFSLGTVWEETIAFLRREFALLLPVALATFGIAQLLFDVGMAGGRAGATPSVSATQALFMLPAFFLLLLGNLTVTRIVLVPGKSVGESFADALRRIPGAILAMLLLSAIMMGIGLLVVIAATLGAMVFQIAPQSFTQQIVLLLIIPMFIIMIRMLLLVPVLAMEERSPPVAIRRAWALSRRELARVFGIFAIVLLLAVLLGLVQTLVVGSVAKLLGYAVGGQLASLLGSLVNAGLQGVFGTAATVFFAIFYRRVTSDGA